MKPCISDLKSNLKTKLIKASTMAMMISALGPIRAFADDADVDWIEGSGSDSTLNTLNEKAKDYSRSVYQLMMTIGVACAVICGLMAAIKIMSGDPKKRNEGKDTIFWVLIGAALIGGVVSIIGFAMSIGKGL